jgi:hypothetical protein
MISTKSYPITTVVVYMYVECSLIDRIATIIILFLFLKILVKFDLHFLNLPR